MARGEAAEASGRGRGGAVRGFAAMDAPWTGLSLLESGRAVRPLREDSRLLRPTFSSAVKAGETEAVTRLRAQFRRNHPSALRSPNEDILLSVRRGWPEISCPCCLRRDGKQCVEGGGGSGGGAGIADGFGDPRSSAAGGFGGGENDGRRAPGGGSGGRARVVGSGGGASGVGSDDDDDDASVYSVSYGAERSKLRERIRRRAPPTSAGAGDPAREAAAAHPATEERGVQTPLNEGGSGGAAGTVGVPSLRDHALFGGKTSGTPRRGGSSAGTPRRGGSGAVSARRVGSGGRDMGEGGDDGRTLELGQDWYALEGGEELLPGARGSGSARDGSQPPSVRWSAPRGVGGQPQVLPGDGPTYASPRPGPRVDSSPRAAPRSAAKGTPGVPGEALAQAKRDGVRAGLEVGLRRGYESAMQDFLSAMRDPSGHRPSAVEQAMTRGVAASPGAAAAAEAAAAAAEAAAPSPEVFVRIGQTPGSSHRLWAALDREGLGEWAPLLSSRRAQVTVDDLPLLVESDFEKLGIPLGPRKRLAALAKRMWDESLARDDLLPPPLSPTPSLALA